MRRARADVAWDVAVIVLVAVGLIAFGDSLAAIWGLR